MRLAAGVITAGGTLGILIPPSVMIIVYAAVAGQSVVKLYASAMFPGFFLAFLYLVYIIGWALINPKIAPRAAGEPDARAGTRVGAPSCSSAYSRNMLVALVSALLSPAKALAIEADGGRVTYWQLLKNFIAALVPLAMTAITLLGSLVVRGHPPAGEREPGLRARCSTALSRRRTPRAGAPRPPDRRRRPGARLKASNAGRGARPSGRPAAARQPAIC